MANWLLVEGFTFKHGDEMVQVCTGTTTLVDVEPLSYIGAEFLSLNLPNLNGRSTKINGPLFVSTVTGPEVGTVFEYRITWQDPLCSDRVRHVYAHLLP